VVIQAEIEIDKSVDFDGRGNLTVDGAGRHRVFSVREGAHAALSGLTVTGGFSEGDTSGDDDGAAIANFGTLRLKQTTISGNRCGAFCSYAISNEGDMDVDGSTISRNEAGGIGNVGGTLRLFNSTVSETGNTIDLRAGTVSLNFSTVSGRVSAPEGKLTWYRTLIDGGCSIDSLQTEVVSRGHNIESPGDTCGLDPDETDRVDVTAGQLSLGPLTDNGGPTETHAPGPGSIAIDAIPDTKCSGGLPLWDQRGRPRPERTTDPRMCDVGSVEVQP